MRPVKLRLKGLRSYRTEQEIDFTDADLMAIVGDTGAGKSSLLEAICIALYGCCTWDARSAKPLIADGATSLQVELTFRVGDETWRVTRAISAGAYPPAVHLLECLDDGTRVDNADPVNAAVRRLIGLDFATFLKAVVLPQGRFQILLQMSNTDRTPILKSILGLDHLTAVRECALGLLSRLRPQLAMIQERRAGLLPDPAATAQDARHRLDAANAEVSVFEDARRKIATARIAYSHAKAQAEAARVAADRIVAATVEDPVGAYERLATVDAKVSADETRAAEVLLLLDDHERALQGVLDDAEAAGAGPVQLATAEASLAAVIRELPELENERRRCDAEARDIAGERDVLATRQAGITVFEGEAERADAEAVSAEVAARVAVEHLNAARGALGAARLATQTARDAAVKLGALAEGLEQREQEAAVAEEQAQAAERVHKETVAHLDAVRRAAAAAHAASASHAGDPCPICERLLPDGFVAPAPPGEDDAQTACAAADKEAKARTRKSITAATSRDTARLALEHAVAAANEAERGRLAAVGQATVLLDGGDLNRDDGELLLESEQTVGTTAAAVAATRAAAQTKRDELTRAEAELRPVDEALMAREKALATARVTLDRRAGKLRSAAEELPGEFRVAEPYGAPTLREQVARIVQRQQELAGTVEQLSGVRLNLAQARATLKQLDMKRRAEISGPAEQLRRDIERLAERAAEAAALLDEPAPPGRSDGSLADDAAWARAIVGIADNLSDRSRERAIAEAELADGAKTDVSTAFAAAGVEDEAHLDDRLIAASADSRVAKADLQTAEAQAPIAADLDTRIRTGSPFIVTLDELARLLTDGKFVGTVIKRKQRALLGVASELLATMTGGRFGFAETFQIADRLSGQPRDVKTLSGGETFLASLALALALVELAARGVGRLEALFLDEGFGSLDANSLADALDALSRQAEGGRLVAVISHLRAVAENIEHVLVVSKGPGGSEVHWAKGAERDELIANELPAGLIA